MYTSWLHRSLYVICLAVGFVCLPLAFAQASSEQVRAFLAFDRLSQAVNNTDGIDFRSIPALPNDTIVMNTNGAVSIEGKGPTKSRAPMTITIEDKKDQTMNFFSGNFRSNSVMVPEKALCALDKNEERDCANIMINALDYMHTLSIGMKVKVIRDLAFLDSRNPSFDLSLVYQ